MGRCFLKNSLMTLTCAAFNFAVLHFSPRRLRRLEALSAMLSAAVPRNRCSGLTQHGLSHMWHTIMPGGMSPMNSAYDALCALRVRPLWLIAPYPLSNRPAVHSQHPLPDTACRLRIRSLRDGLTGFQPPRRRPLAPPRLAHTHLPGATERKERRQLLRLSS